MQLRLAVIGIVIWAGTYTANASPISGLYGSDRDGSLFLINTTNATTTLIGGSISNRGSSTEIEYDNIRGTAYSQDADGAFSGNFFDMVTVSRGGTFGNRGSHTGLEYVGSTLYSTVIFDSGGRAPSELHTLDPSLGVSTLIGLTGVSAPIAGLAYDGATMYGIAGGPGPATLYTINLGNGVATSVFTTSFQAGSLQFGLDGNLYAGGTGPNGGNLFRIDLNNNTDTLVGPTGFSEITGLTLVIPEPTTLALAVMGMMGVACCRRRR